MSSANALFKCRVCCCELSDEGESYDMRQLPMLALKFTSCTDLTVLHEEKNVPSALCQSCYDLLDQLYAFRARCIEADAKWRLAIVAEADEEKVEVEIQELESPQRTQVKPFSEEPEIELPEVETTAQDAIETSQKTVEQVSLWIFKESPTC